MIFDLINDESMTIKCGNKILQLNSSTVIKLQIMIVTLSEAMIMTLYDTKKNHLKSA